MYTANNMWQVIYDVDGITIMYDDGNDVWSKFILYTDIMEGMHSAYEDHYRMSKTNLNSIYGSTKEDNSNGTH